MICPKCQSENTGIKDKNYTANKIRMQCHDCPHTWSIPRSEKPNDKPKIGMTLNEFRDKHDIAHIVKKTLEKLDPNIIYQKDDIVKLAGISYSAQGLTPILEAQDAYYGKTGGKIYYSHPDTISKLKNTAKLN